LKLDNKSSLEEYSEKNDKHKWQTKKKMLVIFFRSYFQMFQPNLKLISVHNAMNVRSTSVF